MRAEVEVWPTYQRSKQTNSFRSVLELLLSFAFLVSNIWLWLFHSFLFFFFFYNWNLEQGNSLAHTKGSMIYHNLHHVSHSLPATSFSIPDLNRLSHSNLFSVYGFHHLLWPHVKYIIILRLIINHHLWVM